MVTQQNSSEPTTRTGSPTPSRLQVLVPAPLDGPFDYWLPPGISATLGDFVRVPFGRREVLGVVWNMTPGETAEDRLKPLLARFDLPPLCDESRQFIDWVASYTLSPRGAVLKMALSVADAVQPPDVPVVYGAVATMPEGLRITDARRRVLQQAAAGPPLNKAELAREAAVSPSVIDGLLQAGGLRALPGAPPEVSAPADPDHPGVTLSPDQQAAAATLCQAVQRRTYGTFLLDGVPGSGKTEVYFEAVAEALRQQRPVLVLLPEIALSAQWLERFRCRFGTTPVVWHSDLTPRQRRLHWRAVALGQAQVVVGARSALFLPFRDIGLIVVDEEHEAAFKQEEGVIYNARDMAVVRARLSNAPVVLASATPSLETVTNVTRGRYQRLHLPHRHGHATMPKTTVIDLTQHPPPPGHWLSPPLLEAIRQTLAQGQQALLFLNRRGYAPLTLCRVCSHRLACPRCTAWLVEHRAAGRLICHHCGYNVRLPETCPACQASQSLTACGPGVERIAEEAATLFPEARRLVATSDTITGPHAAAAMVEAIETHQVDLIIGTQIIAKGYHFPLLTLVGVIDADLGLSGGELRAAERTYQLLYQVAGRAGRDILDGQVLLQSHMPQHPVMAALAAGDRERFLAAEAADRERAAMPPYGRLAALIVSGHDADAVDDAARHLGRTAPSGEEGLLVLGPAPAPLALLRGRHRRRLLVKATRDYPLQAMLRAWLKRASVRRNIRVQVDIDPYTFW